MADTKWTKEQERAISDRGKGIIVSAAAGSGKTTVLINRVINLLKYGRGYEEEMAPVGAVPVDWNPYTQIRRPLGMKKGGLYICPAFDRRCSA